MDFDALTQGVAPGGLRSKNDIRILVCYLLKSVGPLTREEISSVMQQNALANYFEVGDALSSLLSMGNIRETERGFALEAAGENIAENLDVLLPLSVRDKAVAAALSMLATARAERENAVSIAKTEQGYNVTCKISGGDMDLMQIRVYVPDLHQARMVKKNFHKDPQRIYSLLVAALTGDEEITKDLFSE